MSFFYQPQGLGDVPETRDSLVLQFRDTGGVWNNVWALQGKADTAFQRANIHVLDAIFKKFIENIIRKFGCDHINFNITQILIFINIT